MQSPAFIIGWYLGRPVYTLEDRISGTLEILFIKIQVLTKPRVLIKILGLFYFTVFLFHFVLFFNSRALNFWQTLNYIN